VGVLTIERRSDDEGQWRPQSLKDLDLYLDSLAYGGPTMSGQHVGEEQALKLSAVWACVRRLAEPIAGIPFQVFEETDIGRERRRRHNLETVLNRMANPEMTAYEWRETMVAHVSLWGNHYSYIQRDRLDRVRGLIPIHPSRVEIKREPPIRGKLVYYVSFSDGHKEPNKPSEILHIKLFSLDGVNGVSFIGFAREGLGIGLSLEEMAARFFGHGMQLAGTLEHPGPTLSDEAKENLRSSIKERFGGVGKSQGLLLLENGIKYNKMSIPPNDAQFLESRAWSVTDIARWFLVPAPLINDLSQATNSNIEEQDRTFITLTLVPGWCRRIESRVNTSLFLPSETDFYAKLNVDGLLRGDPVARATSLKIRLDAGAINANEWRTLDEMNSIGPQGDIYRFPLNMASAQDIVDGKVQPNPNVKGPADTARSLLAHRALLESQAAVVLRREEQEVIAIARRGLSDPASLRTRLESWFAGHVSFAQAHLRDAVAACAAAAGQGNVEPDAYLGEDVLLQKPAVLACLAEPDPVAALRSHYDARRLSWPGEVADSILSALEV